MGTVYVQKTLEFCISLSEMKTPLGLLLNLNLIELGSLRIFIANLKVLGGTWLNIQPTLSRPHIVEIYIEISLSKHIFF